MRKTPRYPPPADCQQYEWGVPKQPKNPPRKRHVLPVTGRSIVGGLVDLEELEKQSVTPGLGGGQGRFKNQRPAFIS